MKLLKLTPVLLAALVFVLSGCAADTPTAAGVLNEAAPSADISVQATATPTDTHTADEAIAEVTFITASEAESTALSHAGISADKALGLHSEFDSDDRTPNYDVDFCSDGIEYDYEINAATGEVIRVENEKCDHTHKVQNNSEKEAQTDTSKITKNEAKAIALKHAGARENSVRQLEIEYDRDDGVLKYEVSFTFGGYEYDYDIDAKTGKIIHYEKERDD